MSFATATARDLISAALTELNVLAAGEVATADDATLGLDMLNRLIDSWDAERLQLFTVTRTTWTIVSGTSVYTVGVGGTVNIARPVYIEHVNFIDTTPNPDQEYQLQPLTDDAFSKIPQIALTSPFPTSWYYNPTYPLGTLTFWPVPTASTLLGAIYASAAISTITSLSTAISLPPAYQRMVVKNLAVELSPSYSRQPDQLLLKQAEDSVATVKRANRRLADMSFEVAALIQRQSGIYAYSILQGP